MLSLAILILVAVLTRVRVVLRIARQIVAAIRKSWLWESFRQIRRSYSRADSEFIQHDADVSFPFSLISLIWSSGCEIFGNFTAG